MSDKVFAGSGFSFPLGKRTYIMGILNITPDSFSDGGAYFDVHGAVRRAKEIEQEGADILDVGACSTAPNREQADDETELSRLREFLRPVIGAVGIPVSIDTYRPAAARCALEAGAKIINDERGCFSNEMAALCKEYNAGWIYMHTGGGSADKTVGYEQGASRAVRQSFDGFLAQADVYGIPRERLCLDMGIGFGKTMEENIELIQSVNKLKIPDAALLIGLSRKRVIGFLSGETSFSDRDYATAAANTAAIQGGADILRVHNVRAAVSAAKTADGLLRVTRFEPDTGSNPVTPGE